MPKKQEVTYLYINEEVEISKGNAPTSEDFQSVDLGILDIIKIEGTSTLQYNSNEDSWTELSEWIN